MFLALCQANTKEAIIIPTKNEEAIIHQTVKNLQDLRKNNLCEIIIVDGMSNDQTVEFSRPYVDLIITSEPNRGIQQNKGAMLASGEILVFLHADTILDNQAIESLLNIEDCFNWGFFKIKLNSKKFKYKVLAYLINLRTKI